MQKGLSVHNILQQITEGIIGRVAPVHAIKAYRGSRGIAPLILNLGTRWRCVVNFTRRPLYTQQRTPAPTEQKAGSSHIVGLDSSAEEQNLTSLPELERTRQPVASSYTDCDIHRRNTKINYDQPFSNNCDSLENCIVTHTVNSMNSTAAQPPILYRLFRFWYQGYAFCINLLKPTGYVMHQQFNIQQLYVLPTLHLCVLYLSENKQRLVPLTA